MKVSMKFDTAFPWKVKYTWLLLRKDFNHESVPHQVEKCCILKF